MWYLVLAKKPRGRKVKVKIVLDSHVPAKGEVVQILSCWPVRALMCATRAYHGDKCLVKRWGKSGLLDPVDPHGPR